ncbi:MAG: DUF192 domain-containing protein, partial [Gemmatimonadota bacterium]
MRRASTPIRRLAPAGLLSTVLLLACGAGPGEDGPRNGAEDPRSEAPIPARSDGSGSPTSPLPGNAWVIFGADTVVAEVARTAEERSRGLMYRDDVPDGTGMLFVFDRPDVQSFWMENTYVP